MIRGSRSITLPKAGKKKTESSENSTDDDNILARAELRSARRDHDLSDAIASEARSQKRKKSNKSSSSESEVKHHKKHHKQKRVKKSSSSSESDEIESKPTQMANAGLIPILGEGIVNKLNKLPSNYTNEVPEYISNQLVNAVGFNLPADGVGPAGTPNINVPPSVQPMEIPPMTSSPLSDLSSLGITDTPNPMIMANPPSLIDPSLQSMNPSLPPVFNPSMPMSQPLPIMQGVANPNENPMSRLMMNAPKMNGGKYRFTKDGNFF
jgi:hypothetical protein